MTGITRLIAASKESIVCIRCPRRINAIAASMYHDRWHRNFREFSKTPFHIIVCRITGDITEAMPIGMNNDVDEIRIVERRSGAVVGYAMLEAIAERLLLWKKVILFAVWRSSLRSQCVRRRCRVDACAGL
jgi:hypothetical protein